MTKTIEKNVVLRGNKWWIAVICDPALTIKDIMDRLDLGQLVIKAYRDMAGDQLERYWRYPNRGKMGVKAHGLVHGVNKIVEMSGMNQMLNNRVEMWRMKACGSFTTSLKEVVKPGTMKDLDDLTKKAKKPVNGEAVVTVTFTGTAAQVKLAIKKMAALIK